MIIRASREGRRALCVRGSARSYCQWGNYRPNVWLPRPLPWRRFVSSVSTESRLAQHRRGANRTSDSRQQTHRRNYATTGSPPPPQNIAVVGGGLTGLTTAYYLTHFMPNARITVYEASDRLGGWVHTDKVPVTDGEGRDGVVLFERGPRTIQPSSHRGLFDDLVLYELIDMLQLSLDVVGKGDWRKLKRYVFYPDHLVAMPGPINMTADGLPGLVSAVSQVVHIINDVLTEPLFTGTAQGLLQFFRNTSMSKIAGEGPEPDESIGHFFTRLLGGPQLVDNVLSAMVHGIYGGDIWKISVQSSLFGQLFAQRTYKSTNGRPAVVETWLRPGDAELAKDIQDSYQGEDAKHIVGRALASRDWGGLNVAGGFGEITDAMVDSVKENSAVQFRTGSAGRVQKLQYVAAQDKVQVCPSFPLSLGPSSPPQIAPFSPSIDMSWHTTRSRQPKEISRSLSTRSSPPSTLAI
jgi:protoporphyrinogen oxidase